MPAIATKSESQEPLVERVLETAATLSTDERESLLSLINIAVSAVAPDRPISPSVAAAMQLVRRIRSNLPPDDSGVLFCGRPAWVTDDLLAALRREADDVRAGAARSLNCWFAGGGPVSHDVAHSRDVRTFVESLAGPVHDEVKANFTFYEAPGDGVDPHVDRDDFSLIILMVVRHDHAGAPCSAFHVYPPEVGPTRLDLQPGELVLFHAGSTVHQRTRVGVDEHVQTLSLGHRLRDFTPHFPWPTR